MLSRTIYKKQRGRRLLTLLAGASLVGGLFVVSTSVFAVTGPGQGFFELDASLDQSDGAAPKAAVTDNASAEAPDDWDRIAADHGLATNGAGPSNAFASSFDAETTATGTANNATIFTGGGSKDQQPISKWGWKDASGGLPDKDNLLHAMSARYGAGLTSHIYFAADRYDNSGDAQIGFWFFNSQIGTQPDGSFGPGAHKVGEVPHNADNAGDILVLSDFTNGGTQPTIRVYEYVGSGGTDGSLNLLGGTDTDVRDCAIVPTDDFCASVNNFDGAVAPWLFKNKSGQTSFGHGEFYEGGLNLTSLGLQNECFSSFLAETRSAQSVTATLKDFVAGPFQDCNTNVVTTPSVSGSASIGTSGAIAVHDTAAVTVNGTTTFSGTLSFHICGPIASGNCSTGGTAVAAAAGVNPVIANGNYDSADFTIHTAGRYCWRADLTIQSPSGLQGASDPADTTATSECFEINPVQPGIDTVASDDVEVGNPIDDTANLSGTALDPDGSKADGTITFKLYGPDDATCATVIEQSIVTLTNGGDGAYKASDGTLSGTLGSLTPVSAGTYRWVASYSGDSPNTLGVDGACNDANESVVVNPGDPSISTEASAPAPDGAPVGTAIDDTAHLTGTKDQPDGDPAGGTITFKLYGPDDATCTTVIEQSVVNVSGDGFYKASDGTLSGTLGSLTPTAAGTYRWVASYSGDLPNTTSVSGACNDSNEASLLVSLQPTLDTAQRFVPNDSAEVNVASGGGSLAGSIRFRLYDNNTCTPSGTTLYDKTFTIGVDGTLSAGGLKWNVSTDNTTAYSSDKSFSWLVEFTSTNGGHNNVTSACYNEHSSITIVNGSQSNTP